MKEVWPNKNDIILGNDNRYHYFYKIINTNNHNYYYGIHSTGNLYDNYHGSGSLLKHEYKIYGKDIFIKIVLKFFESRQDLLKYEHDIINNDILEDDSCYNLIPGGSDNKMNNCVSVRDADDNTFMMSIDKYRKNKELYKATTKDMVHVHMNHNDRLILKSDINKYLSNGWALGQSTKSSLGKIAINRDSHEKRIYPNEIEYYINMGWNIGGVSRNKNSKSNIKDCLWITKDDINKRIPKSDLNQYISTGWRIGTSQKTIKGYIKINNGEMCKAINKNDLGRYISDGWKLGPIPYKGSKKIWINNNNESKMISISNAIPDGWIKGRNISTHSTIGKISIHKDGITRMIYPEELDRYILDGWVKGNPRSGGPKNSGKIRINNGIINKMIYPKELDKYILDGWVKGSK